MNNWMSDPFKYPTKKFDRGKVLSVEDLKKPWQLPALRPTWMETVFRTARCRERITPAGFRIFTRWKRAQREGRVQRASGRLQAQHGSPQQKVRYGPAVHAAAGNRSCRRCKDRVPGFRYDALGHHRITGSIEPRIQIAGQLPTGCAHLTTWSNCSERSTGLCCRTNETADGGR